ncbi:DUF560 domain-containing protein [[Haemophilus] felis]|nr:DUF560 domain-containing protein [[Haemophilus] felis]
MKKQLSILFALIAGASEVLAQEAKPEVVAPQLSAEPEVKIPSAKPTPVALAPVRHVEPKTLRFAVKELYQNQALTEQVVNLSIEQQNAVALQKALKVYASFAQKDEILLLFGQAQLAYLQGNLPQAIALYRQLIALKPELDVVRFQLAVTLFEDQQNEAAQGQFMQLRARQHLSQQSQQYIQAYLNALQQRETWNVNASAYYVRDNNVNNASSSPVIHSKNFQTLTKNSSMLPQKAQGVSYSLDISRQFNLKHNHYLHFENNLSGKWYWDNHPQDEMYNRTLLGYAYKDAVQEWKALPFYQRQWSGNKRYNKSVGVRLEHSYWLNPRWQLSSVLDVAHHRYHDNQNLNGISALFSQTLFWQQSPTQYFYVGGDISRTTARDSQYANWYKALRLGWGKSWELFGLSSRLNLSIANRKYDDEARLSGWLNLGKRRDDNIYQANLTLWKRDWYWWKITPKLQFTWKKQQSNLPEMYSYQEKNIYLIFEKRF